MNIVASEPNPRELEILKLLMRGYDNAEIATELHIARRTVKAHFNRMFIRYGIVDGFKRVKLVRMFYARLK
jgi:DNA-binding NarL/FixJ family response regulator